MSSRSSSLLNKDGILFRKNKHGQFTPVVPKKLQAIITLYFHRHNAFHHIGREKMEHMISQHFYWIGMRKTIEQIVKQCTACRDIKSRIDM